MGENGLSVHRIADVGGLRALAPSWDQLLDRALPGSPYLTWEWVWTFWQVYGQGPEDPQLYVLAVRSGERLVGLLPLYRVTQGLHRALPALPGLSIRKLRMCATGDMHLPTDLDLIAAADDARAVGRAVADYLWAHRTEWDLLDLSSVRRQGLGAAALALQLARRGGLYQSDVHGARNRYVALPDSFAGYLMRMSPGYAKKLQRYERRLLREHPYRVVVCRAQERLGEDLLDLVRIRMGSWQQESRHAFADFRFLSFHRRVMPLLHRRGWLRLVFLEDHAGQRLAGGYVILRNGLATFYQQARLVDLEKLHVGSVLIGHLLQLAIAEGAHSFDFGVDAPYKTHFAFSLREDRHLRVYGCTLAGFLQRAKDELRMLLQGRFRTRPAPRLGG